MSFAVHLHISPNLCCLSLLEIQSCLNLIDQLFVYYIYLCLPYNSQNTLLSTHNHLYFFRLAAISFRSNLNIFFCRLSHRFALY